MKRSKFSEAQIAFVLKQAENGTTIGEVWRRAGISDTTFYAGAKKYARLMPSEMRRLPSSRMRTRSSSGWSPTSVWKSLS